MFMQPRELTLRWSSLWARRALLILIPLYVINLLTMMEMKLTAPLITTFPLQSPIAAKEKESGASLHRQIQDSLINFWTDNIKSKYSEEEGEVYKLLAHQIAMKWNLSTPSASTLLERQFYKQTNYNPQTDLLHFHHIPKTGGTTISDILNATFGQYTVADNHYGGGIMPGSARSGSFEPKQFHSAMLRLAIDAAARDPNVTVVNRSIPNYLASFGHTRLRPIRGPNKTSLADFFDHFFSTFGVKKRLRSLAMLREPTNLRASTHAMAMCALNGKVTSYNWRREKRGLHRVCTPDEGLNISALVDDYIRQALKVCPNKGKTLRRNLSMNRTLNKIEKRVCYNGTQSMDHCRSAKHLLSSTAYDGMQSMYKGLMGRYYAQQEMGLMNYVSIEKSMRKKSSNHTFSVENIEEYTLVDLGGLDLDIQHSAYDISKIIALDTEKGQNLTNDTSAPLNTISSLSEPDFLWFGITERMTESICLLFYTLNVKPLKVPNARVVDCSPGSWWTPEDREEVKLRELADYSVWRAANAILDVRVLKMQRELRRRFQEETNLEEMERWNAFMEANCLSSDLTPKI